MVNFMWKVKTNQYHIIYSYIDSAKIIETNNRSKIKKLKKRPVFISLTQLFPSKTPFFLDCLLHPKLVQLHLNLSVRHFFLDRLLKFCFSLKKFTIAISEPEANTFCLLKVMNLPKHLNKIRLRQDNFKLMNVRLKNREKLQNVMIINTKRKDYERKRFLQSLALIDRSIFLYLEIFKSGQIKSMYHHVPLKILKRVIDSIYKSKGVLFDEHQANDILSIYKLVEEGLKRNSSIFDQW